jgi:hypothetical protein
VLSPVVVDAVEESSHEPKGPAIVFGWPTDVEDEEAVERGRAVGP